MKTDAPAARRCAATRAARRRTADAAATDKPRPDARHPCTMSTHVMYDAAQLQWGDAPPALEKGAQVAVLSGDPGKAGPFVIRLKAPAGFKVARTGIRPTNGDRARR